MHFGNKHCQPPSLGVEWSPRAHETHPTSPRFNRRRGRKNRRPPRVAPGGLPALTRRESSPQGIGLSGPNLRRYASVRSLVASRTEADGKAMGHMTIC
jgi:hypothetical protein